MDRRACPRCKVYGRKDDCPKCNGKGYIDVYFGKGSPPWNRIIGSNNKNNNTNIL